MIVAVSRIPLPKTERYLCWVRVAKGYYTNTHYYVGGFAVTVWLV